MASPLGLPEGFELDQKPQSVAGLPEGFVLDNQPSTISVPIHKPLIQGIMESAIPGMYNASELPPGTDVVTQGQIPGKGIIPAIASGFTKSAMGKLGGYEPVNYTPEGIKERLANMTAGVAANIPLYVAGYGLGAGPVTGMASSFALPKAVETVIDTQGQPFGERLAKTATETAKAYAVGGLTGVAGKVLPVGLKTLGEVGAMGTAGPVIQEGRVPTLQDYLDPLAFLATIKGIRAVKGMVGNKVLGGPQEQIKVNPSDLNNPTPEEVAATGAGTPTLQETINRNLNVPETPPTVMDIAGQLKGPIATMYKNLVSRFEKDGHTTEDAATLAMDRISGTQEGMIQTRDIFSEIQKQRDEATQKRVNSTAAFMSTNPDVVKSIQDMFPEANITPEEVQAAFESPEANKFLISQDKATLDAATNARRSMEQETLPKSTNIIQNAPEPQPMDVTDIRNQIEQQRIADRVTEIQKKPSLGTGVTLESGGLQTVYDNLKKWANGEEGDKLALLSRGINTAQDKLKGTAPGNFVSSLSLSLKKGFAPGAISPKAGQAGDIIASRVMDYEQFKNMKTVQSQQMEKTWEAQDPKTKQDFMFAMDEGKKLGGKAGEIADSYTRRFEDSFNKEQAAGITFEPIKDYFVHIFDNAERARTVLNEYVKSLGKDSFTQQRQIRFLRTALSLKDVNGEPLLKLKSDNPETNVVMRELSSEQAIFKQNAVNDMVKYGIAEKVTDGIDKEGKFLFNGPDGKQYAVSEDVAPMIKNALLSKSLWADEGWAGQLYRGTMAIKNTFVPIKLALSLFHPLHVATIDMSARRAAVWENILKGNKDYQGALKDLVSASTGASQIAGFKDSWGVVKAWDKPMSQLTDIEAQAITTIKEGGGTAKMSEVYRINAEKAFRKAVQERSYPMAGVQGVRKLIESMQKPIFEVYIPSLKVGAYLREAQMLFDRQPELLENDVARKSELNKIWKSVDNRYGEVNYSTLFWNKYLKEIGIGASLSMGWTLGNIREFSGALADAGKYAKGGFKANDISRRMLFAVDYTLQSAIIGGLITYAFTGAINGIKDLFAPRTGGQNQDGSEERMTTPFYTKDFISHWEHMRKEGVIGGTIDMFKNKAAPMIAPMVNLLWKNEDFYNNQIRDTRAPIMKQTEQAVKYLLGEALPISVSSYNAGKKTDSVTQYTGFLGLPKAPGYLTRTPIQNEILHLSETRNPRGTRSSYETQKGDVQKEIKDLYYQGKFDEANSKIDEAVNKGLIKEQSVNTFMKRLDYPADIKAFSTLPPDDQEYLLGNMTEDEVKRYIWSAHQDVRDTAYKLSDKTKKVTEDYQKGLVTEPKWYQGKMIQQ